MHAHHAGLECLHHVEEASKADDKFKHNLRSKVKDVRVFFSESMSASQNGATDSVATDRYVGPQCFFSFCAICTHIAVYTRTVRASLLCALSHRASAGMLDRLKQNISEFKQNVNEIQDVMSFGPMGLFDDNSGSSAGACA